MLKTIIKYGLVGLVLFITGIFLFSASWFTPTPDHPPTLIAHRGVHQAFDMAGLTNQTCTAERIFTPTHTYLENTLPSMTAAYDYGADIVEIDIIRTIDNEFAVFHDWTLECRTDGTGPTRDQTMAALKKLDIGYGYTSDGGQTFPFRGKGVGMMPTLSEVLKAFPDKGLLINVKGNTSADAVPLAEYIATHVENQTIRLFAGPRFAAQWRQVMPKIKVGTRKDAKECAISYLLNGWAGHTPSSCDNFGLVVPLNYRAFYWGWPKKTVSRLDQRGMMVLLTGPLNDNAGRGAIDDLTQFAKIPTHYRGAILTNRIEIIGPAVKGRLNTQ